MDLQEAMKEVDADDLRKWFVVGPAGPEHVGEADWRALLARVKGQAMVVNVYGRRHEDRLRFALDCTAKTAEQADYPTDGPGRWWCLAGPLAIDGVQRMVLITCMPRMPEFFPRLAHALYLTGERVEAAKEMADAKYLIRPLFHVPEEAYEVYDKVLTDALDAVLDR